MTPPPGTLCRYLAVEVLSLLGASMGATDAARERADVYLEQSRQESVLHGTGALMHALGVAALAAGDLDRAEQWAASLYEQEPQVGYTAWHVQELMVAVALARGDSVLARVHVERLLAAAEPFRNRRVRAVAHLGLARAVLLEGDDQRAESVAQDALKVLTDHGWRPLVTDALDLLADIALFRRQHERAVRLTAGARALRSALGLVAFSPARKRTERPLAAAGTALGDEKLKLAARRQYPPG